MRCEESASQTSNVAVSPNHSLGIVMNRHHVDRAVGLEEPSYKQSNVRRFSTICRASQLLHGSLSRTYIEPIPQRNDLPSDETYTKKMNGSISTTPSGGSSEPGHTKTSWFLSPTCRIYQGLCKPSV
jgi:hypothetical protein